MEEKIERVREIVKENHRDIDYKYHIIPVVKNALLLADKLNADKEVVEVAALLHDIGRVETIVGKYKAENEHHIIGEKEAEKILKKLNFEKEFIDKVKHCVLTHRGRADIPRETIEAKIVASADAMSHFDSFLLVPTVFSKTTDNFEELITEIEAKMQRNWNKKLIPEAKEIVKEKYKAIMLIIKSTKEYMK